MPSIKLGQITRAVAPGRIPRWGCRFCSACASEIVQSTTHPVLSHRHTAEHSNGLDGRSIWTLHKAVEQDCKAQALQNVNESEVPSCRLSNKVMVLLVRWL